MFEETLYQKARDGRQFVDVLLSQGIYPGIKVDTGLQVGLQGGAGGVEFNSSGLWVCSFVRG